MAHSVTGFPLIGLQGWKAKASLGVRRTRAGIAPVEGKISKLFPIFP